VFNQFKTWGMRALWTMVALAVIALVFFWSPKEKTYSDGKIHIEYWHTVGQDDVVPWPVTAFNASQDSIVVHPVPIPWQENEKKVLTAIISANPPSIVTQFVPLVKWASRMALRPLDDMIHRDDFDSGVFYPALMEEMEYHGHVFGLPYATASYVLYYNKDHFREAGLDPSDPPKTWDDLATMAHQLDSIDANGRIHRMGFMPDWDNLYPSIMQTSLLMAWGRGATLSSDDGRQSILDDPRMIESLEWVADYYSHYDMERVKKLRGTFGYDAQHCFLAGKVSMFIGSNYLLDNLSHYTPDLDFGLTMIPAVEKEGPSACAAGVFWLAIPKGAQHPEAAWEFLKFATRWDIQLASLLNMDESLFPSNRLTANSTEFRAIPNMSVFAEQMEYAHSPAVIPMAHEVFWRELNLNVLGVVQDGRRTAAEALQAANAQVQRELEAALEYADYVHARMTFGTEGILE